ncbi:MAG: aminotransferase class I/II-fold pyridoxal phosphate-dependent enzyme [Acidiferrobacterales bacterium]
MKHTISQPIKAALESKRLFWRFLNPDSPYSRLRGAPDVADFALGNPQEMPLPGFAEALQRWTIPRNKDWFTYTLNRPEAQAVVAASLRERMDMPFEADDIAMTNGAFAGLAVTIRTVAGPGDEVIFNSPPWFNYESIILSAGAVPRRVKVNLETFDLDIDAITNAISPRSRAIIVNSPNNPTGKIFPPETLKRLAVTLTDQSKEYGRPIYLISDESYNRIVFDGLKFHSPVGFYPYSFLIYTYGKTLLTPGERIGYIALPPTMPDREKLHSAITVSQLMTGWAFPNVVLQYAMEELERLSIDVGHLEQKRDRLVAALRRFGYELHIPEGTFYLLVRSPWEDDWAFMDLLATHKILVLPASVVELPGYFRVSLTANDEMIDRALPGFEAAISYAATNRPETALRPHESRN